MDTGGEARWGKEEAELGGGRRGVDLAKGWDFQHGAASFSAGNFANGGLRSPIVGPAAFNRGKEQIFPSPPSRSPKNNTIFKHPYS